MEHPPSPDSVITPTRSAVSIVSANGASYREILSRPVDEVVSGGPSCDVDGVSDSTSLSFSKVFAGSDEGDDVGCVEAPWVPFRVSARRIGVCPRSSVQSCVSVPCAWSTTQAREGGPRSIDPCRRAAARCRHRDAADLAIATAPPSRSDRRAARGGESPSPAGARRGATCERDPEGRLSVFRSGTRPPTTK